MGKTRLLLLFCFIMVISSAGATRSSLFKRIKTSHGDIYDCVDINKQPSLQHPALKDHKVQISPPRELVQFIERRIREKYGAGGASPPRVKIGLKQGCPFGTVPIRRLASQNLTKPSTTYFRPLDDDTSRPGVQFAGLLASGSQIYAGAVAYLGLYNPKVEPNQRSSSIVALISRDKSTFNRIEAGWTVNPSEYGDTKTRLYASWTSDGYRSTGCFDTRCPGFILTSSTTPLGYVFTKVSKWREFEMDTQILIIQIPKDKTWWLILEGDIVGYWPKEILTTMAYGAQMVKFGGEVFSQNPSQSSPEMGSGTYWDGLDYTTAIDRGVNVLNASALPIHPDPSFTSTKQCECYFAGANYDRGGKDGYCFLYGGGGGEDCTCGH